MGAPAATVAGDRHSLPTSYQVNVAYQRDVGFSTTVEAAYVGNFTHNDRRTYNLDVLPLYVFADPKNQFNQAALSQNYLFTKFPGMANITDFTNDLETLRYHSLQLSVQRRLSRGLQMGLAYTLSKGMGMQGWDPYTADPNQTINMGGTMVQGGPDALKARYWGPTAVDRRHNLTVNYSYAIPTLMKDNKVVARSAQPLADLGRDEAPERHRARIRRARNTTTRGVAVQSCRATRIPSRRAAT